MFRLLLICATFLLLYFGFTFIESFDSKVFISLYDYNIETTLFFSLILGLLLLISCFIVIRFLILIIDLPSKIHNIFSKRKINHDRYALILAFAEYIMNNKAKSASIARKNLSSEDLTDSQEFHNLILAVTEEDVDRKISYFQKLITSKEFVFYGSKNLAKLYYDKSFYKKAENYATKAYNFNELDLDNLITLMRCYARVSLWTKFIFITNKLAKFHKHESMPEIAEYYLLAAKQEVESNNTANAIDYLATAVDLNFYNDALLEFYFNLNNKLNVNRKIKILKDAFRIIPSLKLVQLFKKFTSLSDRQIYEELIQELDAKKDEILILAIEAYLEL
ncbi:tetratricopeptide repeat protein [Rickettsia sp. Tenjiku01]|uniref:tetratricopeptide repeat protein n=1 Tax=Rickettsia sp. Tenjiku01 TaxID=1736693 RepID=UPI0007DAFBD2|nr:heme biosynthesis HemY N-terminal domain-containing protein [Rickettsia sp. Tenjiku01]